MLLTHAHMWTRSISKKMAAGDGTHSKQHNFIEQFLQSDYPSSFTAAGVHVTELLFMHVTSLQSVEHFCVHVCACVWISVILSPVWPHRIATVNPPSGIPVENRKNTHTQPWQLGDSAGASIVPVESSREGYHGSLSSQISLSSLLFSEGVSAPVTHRLISWLPCVEASNISNW